ncbi:MAG: periplasmic heavy metal sensor [Bacteroidales bacterium]|nr:periplasmic heavy metal sensor [Bacteroidales bacterium]
MNYFTKKRLVVLLIGFLLIINVAAISTIVFHRYMISDRVLQNKKIENPVRFMRKALSLDSEQEKIFTNLNSDYQKNSSKTLESLKTKRVEMLKEISLPDPNIEKLDEIADEIGVLHADLKKLTINNFLDMKENCTPEQQQKLKKMYRKILMGSGHKVDSMDRKFKNRPGEGKEDRKQRKRSW